MKANPITLFFLMPHYLPHLTYVCFQYPAYKMLLIVNYTIIQCDSHYE